MKKNMMGTKMILKVLPTKSAAASRIAIDITSDLHMQSIAAKYKKAINHIAKASTLSHTLEELSEFLS